MTPETLSAPCFRRDRDNRKGFRPKLGWDRECRTARSAAAVPLLMLGDSGALTVRKESVLVPGLSGRVRVVWISDLHFWRRRSLKNARAIMEAASHLQPAAFVLGGDLVDSEAGLPVLKQLTRRLVRLAPVYALAGNHDEAFGVPCVKDAVLDAGGIWLSEGETPIPGAPLILHYGAVPSGGTRRETGKASVQCRHDPKGCEMWDGRVDAILAGHLHGGQIAFFHWRGRSWPCAAIYRWCGARFLMPQGTTLVVGSGAGDLLPVRWRCPREVVCLDLIPADLRISHVMAK